jgi:hypothetical protein
VVGGGCCGQNTPMQGQTEPSWQNGADVWYYSHNSTVFGLRRELEKNSLVTAIERLLVKWMSRCSQKGARTGVCNRDGRQSEFTFAGEHLRA